MHLLLLGYSRIARKRVIGALAASGRITALDIASASSAGAARAEQKMPGAVFDSYEIALEKSGADLIYVSLPNRMHATWAEKALRSGRHVIVDKPGCTSCDDARRLCELARSQNLLLAEANVFAYHPQIERVKDEFRAAATAPTRITALFSFPPLKEDDFRYQERYGGGAFNDLGPYAISAGTVFFREYPRGIFCRINSRAGNGIETAFSIAALYSRGRSMVGHFGFDTEYQNTITVLGPSLCVRFDRVFTITPDCANTLYIRRKDQSAEEVVPPADCFLNFFNHMFAACGSKAFDGLYDRWLAQAAALAMLKDAAKKEDNDD
jgi:predicted dehydrogenase